jgi:hypothetical protein
MYFAKARASDTVKDFICFFTLRFKAMSILFVILLSRLRALGLSPQFRFFSNSEQLRKVRDLAMSVAPSAMKLVHERKELIGDSLWPFSIKS